MKTHCRQWVCGHCDCLVISLIFRLTTFDVRIRRQKSSKSANRVFYISLNKGYFGKTIFSRLFSARYHILKKKKKNTILGLCRCSVDNYSLNPGRPALSVLTAQSHMHDGGRALPQCCFNDGPHFQRSGDVETVLFQGITLITFEILDQTSPNFQGSRRNGCEWCVQNYM